MKGLVIDEPWISLTISGQKTWEMRSRNTLVRGGIALIRKGSKTVVGTADLVRTLPKLSQSELKASVEKHRVPNSEISEVFKYHTAWCWSTLGRYGNPCHTAILRARLSG
jgi:hypothetical protein